MSFYVAGAIVASAVVGGISSNKAQRALKQRPQNARLKLGQLALFVSRK
jgi:hypothetical protein